MDACKKAGAMLIAALWLLALVSMAAVTLSRYLSTEASLMRYHWARAQAKAWAKSGVYLAMERLAREGKDPGEDDDWLGDNWATDAPRDVGQHGSGADSDAWAVQTSAGQDYSGVFSGRMTIQISDEERKLDLNTATEAQLTRLLSNATTARAIVEYRDATAVSSHQHARFQNLEELLGISVVSAQAEVMQRLIQETTVYTQGILNINTVESEALAALTPDRGLVEALVSSRVGPDGQLGTDDDCKATTISTAAAELASCASVDEARLVSLLSLASFDVHSHVFKILASGEIDSPPVRYRIQAIVRRGGAVETFGNPVQLSGERFAILSWRESA